MLKRFISGSTLQILLHNPSLILKLFSANFDEIYCSYWVLKLKEARRLYEEYMGKSHNNPEGFIKDLQTVNNKILSKSYSRIEAFYTPLYMITRKLEPDTVIETGVHRGVSALFILQALEDNGKGMLYSIDLPYASYTTDRKEITKSSLPENKIGICVQTRLRNRWKLILGNSRKELPALLEKVKNVDIFLHDSEHTFNHMM